MISQDVRGFNIKLQTIPGAFSKKGIDEGSKLLINTMKVTDGTMIADFGCGPGAIGIVAAKLNPKGKVHLLDVNLRIVSLAKTNIKLNGIKNAEVFLSDLFSAVENVTYDQILSNPPFHLGNDFLDETMEKCYKHLNNNSSLLLVVQNHLKPFITRLLDLHFGNSKVIARGTKHIVLEAKKTN